MATIKHKRGTSNPGTSDVAVGELAINTTDGGLFTKTDGGSVVEIGDVANATDSTKMPTAGGTFTGDVLFQGATSGRDIVWDKSENRLWVKDNAEITFGTGHDMKLYHDGSNSIILDSGTGYLYLKGENVVLEDTSGDNYFLGIHDGECGVYYDGGVRIKTRSDGAEVLSANGSYVAFYISSDGGVGYNDYTDTWALVVGDGDGVFRLRSKASSSGYETAIKAVANGKVELRYNSSAKIETTSTGVTVTGLMSATTIDGAAGDNLSLDFGSIA